MGCGPPLSFDGGVQLGPRPDAERMRLVLRYLISRPPSHATEPRGGGKEGRRYAVLSMGGPITPTPLPSVAPVARNG